MPKVGQVPKRVTVKTPPRLEVIQLASPELVVADLGGNGIDLSGSVRTSLVTGSPAGMHLRDGSPIATAHARPATIQ